MRGRVVQKEIEVSRLSCLRCNGRISAAAYKRFHHAGRLALLWRLFRRGGGGSDSIRAESRRNSPSYEGKLCGKIELPLIFHEGLACKRQLSDRRLAGMNRHQEN